MRLKLLIAFFTLAMIPDQNESTKHPFSPHFTLYPVAQGVWAAIHREEPGSHAICNAGIIDLGDKTVIVDPFMNIDAAEDLKKVSKLLTKRTPDYVINTHFHNDHIRGNQVFLPATIVSTAWTKEQIAINEPDDLKWEKEHAASILNSYRKREPEAKGLEKKEIPLWINYFEGLVMSNPLIKTTLPNITFQDSFLIVGTKRNIKLKEFNHAHTQSDAVIYIPSDEILFAGDMYFQHAHPWLSEGNPDSLKSYLHQFEKDNQIKKVVPGHGPLAEKKDLKSMIQYINDLQEMVKSNKQKGVPDSIIVNIPIPERYKDWTFGTRFYEANLQFFCKRLSR